MTSTPLCDLCEQPPNGPRHDGSEFKIDGLICGQCRKELADERAVARARELASRRYHNPTSPDKQLYVGPTSYRLPIWDPFFEHRHLTTFAITQLEVAAAAKRAKRQPKAPTPPGEPCVQCSTTKGKIDRRYDRPVRVNGAKFGRPGLHCWRCYNRLRRANVGTSLIGGAA